MKSTAGPTGAPARVARALLEGGPQTAAALAERLGLTTTAVRRHLDALVDAGHVEAGERAPYGPGAVTPVSRGRGRPATVYSVPPRAATPSSRPTTTSRSARCASSRRPAEPDAVEALRRGTGSPSSSAATPAPSRTSRPSERPAGPRRRAQRRRLRRLGRRERRPASPSRSASTTARSATWPPSSPRSARPRPRRSAACSAPTSPASPRSPTATASAPPSSRRHAPRTPRPRPHHAQEVTSMTTEVHDELEGLGRYDFGWADSDAAGANARRGLNEDVVRDISAKKNEPEWMLDMRLKALRLFGKKPMPTWGSDLSGIDFDNIKYFVRSTEKQADVVGRPARRHQEHLRPARHPRGREAAPRRPASPRSTSPRSSTTRSARTSRSRASSSSTPTPACASTRTCSRSTSAR